MSIRVLATKFPEEFAIIGRLLSGYTGLELDLAHCIVVVGNDFDTVTKVLYRLRGETTRIDAADAFGRQQYDMLGLGTEFCMAIGYVRHCMKIRNQFAHCLWWDYDGKTLGFANMEDAAKLNTKISNLKMLDRRVIDLSLLKSQEKFFEKTEKWLCWLNHECRLVTGKIQAHAFTKLSALTKPEPYIP